MFRIKAQRISVGKMGGLVAAAVLFAFLSIITILFNNKTEASVPSSQLSIVQISAGNGHTCVIASDNQAYCWGLNSNGQLGNNSTTQSTVPVAVNTAGVLAGKTIQSISAGTNHTCAIASDGLAYCWGYNNTGHLGNNSTAQSTVPVAVNTAGVLSGKTIQSISASINYTCATASDNQAYCWGYNNNGQLGNNSTTDSSVPVAVTTSGVLSGKTVKYISTYNRHTCVVASDNQAYCWGLNTNGQLGNNSTTDSSVPVAVNAIIPTIPVSQSVFRVYGSSTVAAPGSPLALTDTAATLNSIGQSFRVRLGLTNTKDTGAQDLGSVASGSGHTCTLAVSGKVYCWGQNTYGQLGNNSVVNRSAPAAVNTAGVLAGKTITAIAVGQYHSLALASDGKVYAWGNNSNGQLGDNSLTSRQNPVAVNTAGVLSGKTITAIAAYEDYSLALASDGKVYAWGKNTFGQLGNNTTTNSSVPVAVDVSGVLAGKTIAAIASGSQHSAALDSNGEVYTWGYNSAGQLGNNTIVNSSVPVKVTTAGTPMNGKTIVKIASGRAHILALASDGTTYAWGYNQFGQLGNNATTNRIVPVAVDVSGVLSGKTVQSISAGDSHSCAVASDNQVYCWGLNSDGQLGNNSTTQSNVPVAVNTTGVLSGKTIKSISISTNHSCAVASDNQAYCWGDNGEGQFGDGSTSGSLVPVKTNVIRASLGMVIKSISAGDSHTCAIASDNQAYCWGLNTNGQLGNNSTTQSLTPVAVDTSGVLAGKTIKSISAGYNHTCAIASDNQAYCWGEGNNGQLGNNSTTQSNVPVAVTTSGVLSGKTVQSISTSTDHTCVIASDNQPIAGDMALMVAWAIIQRLTVPSLSQ